MGGRKYPPSIDYTQPVAVIDKEADYELLKPDTFQGVDLTDVGCFLLLSIREQCKSLVLYKLWLHMSKNALSYM